MHDWLLKDIPISEFQVIAEPNLLTGQIRIMTNIAGKIREEFLETRDQQLRNALIDLGWTAPDD